MTLKYLQTVIVALLQNNDLHTCSSLYVGFKIRGREVKVEQICMESSQQATYQRCCHRHLASQNFGLIII